MLRNDYRRSLILLRSNASGYAGHVRLERRTLMGSMYFVVQAPEDAGVLQAVLIGRGRTGYFACALGELRRDSARQNSLSVSFDPRSICGRELEEYRLAAVVQSGGNNCRIVLFGNLNGYTEIDWEQATRAACALFLLQNPPVNVPPRPVPPQSPQQPAAPDTPILPTPGLPSGDAPAAPDTPILPTPGLPSGDAPVAPDTPILPTPGLPAGIAEEASEFGLEQPAAELLGTDMNVPWPAEAEGLKDIFAEEPAMRIAPDNEYIYVSAPMPEMSGYDSCAMGLRTEDGKITGIRYALPSLYSPEAPAGLEEYVWAGDNSRGWWVRTVELTE